MCIRTSVLGTAIVTLSLVTTSLVTSGTSAQAFQIVSQSDMTDTDFQTLIKKSQLTEKFVAESRIGNSDINGTHEISLQEVTSTGYSPVVEAQRTWNNAETVSFKLEYDGISKAIYTIGSQVLHYDFAAGLISDLWIRTRADANSSIQLNHLMLTSGSTSKSFSLESVGTSSSDVDYIQVKDLEGAFTLTGQSLMSWTFTRPSNSQLAYQINAGITPRKKVPEPMALGALAIAAISLYRWQGQTIANPVES